jgi:UDP-N-acetylglucosamine 2-epimerase (non-hydrolysing)
MRRILHVVGARPNFMKVAPIMWEMAKHPQTFAQILLHTGQHYNANMSQVFLDELDLPHPEVNLEVGSGSHAWQTAQVMLRFEPAVLDYKPDWVIVVGDVNSTLACALVCSKLGIRVAHVEAGLRSFDRTMPEEINRLLTDQIADLLLTPSPEANENLLREGIIPGKIRFVGNVMIDTLVRLLPRAERRWPALSARLARNRYVLVTLHRPSNVDETSTLTEIMAALTEISRQIPVLFPVHPRTRQRIAEAGLHPQTVDLQLVEPLGYLDFLALESHAELVLTDSGGVQEETTYLGVPCLTARPNTERPITVSAGTNRLVEGEREALVTAVRAALQSKPKHRTAPPLWDGLAARRIVQTIARAGRNVSPPLGGVCEVVIPGAL